jgi:hypothetical protein
VEEYKQWSLAVEKGQTQVRHEPRYQIERGGWFRGMHCLMQAAKPGHGERHCWFIHWSLSVDQGHTGCGRSRSNLKRGGGLVNRLA